MKKEMLMLLLMTMCFASAEVMAADIKLGYVDVRSAIESTKAYQDGISRLEKLRKKRQKVLSTLKDKILKAAEDLRSKSMIMSPDRLSQKQEELQSMNKLFERKKQDAQESLSREKNRLDQGMLSDFLTTVKEYGKEKKYDLILPKQQAILYASDVYDLTAKVTKALDKQKK